MKKTIVLSALLLIFCSAQLWAQNTPQQEAQTKTLTVKITGLTCAGCNSKVHKTLSGKEGIIDNSVEYPGDVAIVKYNPVKISEAKIIDAIVALGYKAEVISEKKTEKEKTK
jgi:periplasmic mercuric ion binding protein